MQKNLNVKIDKGVFLRIKTEAKKKGVYLWKFIEDILKEWIKKNE
jgi:predicted HicB family RNase H-like nuclease